MLLAETEHIHASMFGRRVTLHSQPETEQDQWVINVLGGKENGTFIELGAFDGVYHSNTLCLERDFGWNGWLIEAIEQYAAKARHARFAEIVNVAVGPEETDLEFYVAGQWSGLHCYTRPNLLEGHACFHSPTTVLHTHPLQKVLRDLRVPEVIDYLSLDTEGAEYPILKSYFRDPPAMFRCLTIEVGDKADDIQKLCALLEPLGYRLDKIQAWESYFLHPELCNV